MDCGTDAAVVAHLKEMLDTQKSDASIASFCRSLSGGATSSTDSSTNTSNANISPTSSTLVAQNEFSIKALFSELFSSYKVLLEKYPVRTKAVTSATISMLGTWWEGNVKSV